MATQPKASTPQFFWVDHVGELQALVEPSDFEWQAYDNLLRGSLDFDLLETAIFCAAAQPAPTVLTATDFLNGTWKQKLREFALRSVYYNLCEEVE